MTLQWTDRQQYMLNQKIGQNRVNHPEILFCVDVADQRKDIRDNRKPGGKSCCALARPVTAQFILQERALHCCYNYYLAVQRP
jgi:hypothetical protein